MATLTAGTIFLVWLADEITKRGLGNGVMLILAVGMLVDMPHYVVQFLGYIRQGGLPLIMLLVISDVVVAVIALVVFVENARLYIPVRFPG
jgi:preprotein translocase subunit SecY